MAEEKKPGFFKRLFGWGKAAPEPEAAIPEPSREALPLPAPLPAPVPVADPVPEAQPEAPSAVVADDVATVVADTSPEPAETEPAVVAVPDDVPGADLPADLPPVAPVPGTDPAPVTDLPAVPDAVAVPPEQPAPVVAALPVLPPEPVAQPKRSFWQRLKEGLSRTSSSLTNGITDIFTKRKLDASTLEDLEDILIQADIGIDASARIAKAVGAGRYEKGVTPDAVRAILAREVAAILRPVAQPLAPQAKGKPVTILMVGVNGSGKTTTIGKLAAKFRSEGLKVVMAAGDTFRAAAIEQLKIWGERTGTPVIAREQGSDAAGLAFDALKQAQETGADVLLIDTAGRLQNKQGLMEELAKIVRVLKKLDPDAPHATLLVLDATVGQNAVSQVEAFTQIAGVTGLVMTKLDGTARGGILVALAQKFGVPVHLIGVGEGIDDLEVFDPDAFARAIAGLEETA